MATRRELVEAIQKRYQHARLAKKTAILDEFIEVTGYHRKHAVRLLGSNGERRDKKLRSKERIYGDAVQEALILLWEAADRICGKRLKALVPLLLGSMEKHGHLQLETSVRDLLLQMSAATMDRLLAEPRERVTGTRRRRGVGATLLRRSIPIRTFGDWKDPEPGYMEADLVAHCGGWMAGSVVHTLVLTDVATGWTECVPLMARDQALIVEALEQVRKALPFPLRGFDTDNDGAFINQTVLNYCPRTGLEFTRSRAYRKNDQAWVEQKNGAVVRKLAGYDRLSGVKGTEKLARLYEFSRPYVNCFQPSFKLKSKTRTGARVSKRYHAPLTPYDRVMAWPHLPNLGKERLQATFAQLDPIELIRNIRCVQEELAMVNNNELEQLKSESAESFLRKLRTVWHEGEVRPTHRRQAARHWRTRPDPFETVRSRIQEQLSLTPDMGAKELFQQLRKEYPGQFAENQIRTLRRRVREWRTDLAKRLILSASNAQSELISPVHIEAARQRKENHLEMGSAQTRDLTLSGQNAFRGR
jgi:hypothetical protein